MMGRYDVLRQERPGYVGIMLGPPEGRITLYVPAPRQGEQVHDFLVHSVLETIAQSCGVEGARVKEERIMEQGRGGGRHKPNPIEGMPTGKDVRAALMRAGYRNA